MDELLEKYLNIEFGSYKVIKYLGYYTVGEQKHKRHYFQKECKFCGNLTHNNPGQINNLISKGDICCNQCKGSINIHTNEKKCSNCQVWFPATNEYFPLSKNRTFGVHYYCLVCHNQKGRKRRENPEVRKMEYEQKKVRLEVDPLFKMTCRIRCQIKNYVKRVDVKKPKSCSTTDILGCSFHEFKSYIEKQFTEGMSWDNYGQWHYEHIVPVSLGKTEEEVIELCHYTNYRPLWGDENLSKSNKIKLEDVSEENKIRYIKYLNYENM